MTTYYVDAVNGSDSNNGLGPDASHATNKPWQTLGKLLGASGFASGDTAYLSPAGPFREVVTVAMTSAVAETKVIGDVANAQGFKTSGGVLVSPGEVIWTAYTTNDTTAPSASVLLSLSARDHLTFQKLTMIAGTNSLVTGGTDATDIAFADCAFYGRLSGSSTAITVTASFGTALNWSFDRCRYFGVGTYFTATATTAGAGADYDMNCVFRNCLIAPAGTTAININASGTSSSRGNGVHLRNCTVIGASTVLSTNNANLSNSVASTVYNSVLTGSNGLTANASGGLITEDYNIINAATARTNVSAGAHSFSDGSRAPLLSLGQEAVVGSRLRPFLQPLAGSPLLGFGGTSQPATDMLNITRPAGGASASTSAGAYERNDTFGKETGTVRTGSAAISITGPGTQDFELPVDGVPTTVTVYVRWDATYAGTKPAMSVLNGSEVGVSDATATAIGSSGAWEQLSLNFTPTGKGIVTIRLVSSDTNGGGKMFADDFNVS